MPFSPIGVYTPAAGALTAAPGGIIKSSVWNAIFTDMSNGFTAVAQQKLLLNTLTAAASATLGDTTSLTSTFRDYDIVLENIVPATNTVSLELQVHSGGTFQATSYINNTFGTVGSTTVLSTVAVTTYIPLACSTIISPGNGVSGVIRISGPVNTTATGKLISGNTTAQGGAIVTSVVAGMWNSTAAIDGFQILFSAGNITSGTVRVYGYS